MVTHEWMRGGAGTCEHVRVSAVSVHSGTCGPVRQVHVDSLESSGLSAVGWMKQEAGACHIT